MDMSLNVLDTNDIYITVNNYNIHLIRNAQLSEASANSNTLSSFVVSQILGNIIFLGLHTYFHGIFWDFYFIGIIYTIELDQHFNTNEYTLDCRNGIKTPFHLKKNSDDSYELDEKFSSSEEGKREEQYRKIRFLHCLKRKLVEKK